MGNGKWYMVHGKWQMANGKWQMANGKWQMAYPFCRSNCMWCEHMTPLFVAGLLGEVAHCAAPRHADSSRTFLCPEMKDACWDSSESLGSLCSLCQKGSLAEE